MLDALWLEWVSEIRPPSFLRGGFFLVLPRISPPAAGGWEQSRQGCVLSAQLWVLALQGSAPESKAPAPGLGLRFCFILIMKRKRKRAT